MTKRKPKSVRVTHPKEAPEPTAATQAPEEITTGPPAPTRTDQIRELGRLLFTQEEVGIILGDSTAYDPDDLAYHQGRLMAEADVRKSILKSASTGSAPAQKQYMDLVDKAKRENRKAAARAGRKRTK